MDMEKATSSSVGTTEPELSGSNTWIMMAMHVKYSDCFESVYLKQVTNHNFSIASETMSSVLKYLEVLNAPI